MCSYHVPVGAVAVFLIIYAVVIAASSPSPYARRTPRCLASGGSLRFPAVALPEGTVSIRILGLDVREAGGAYELGLAALLGRVVAGRRLAVGVRGADGGAVLLPAFSRGARRGSVHMALLVVAGGQGPAPRGGRECPTGACGRPGRAC